MTTATVAVTLARLRRAKHGSRDLDADVFEALGLGWRVKRAPERDGGIAWRYFENSRWHVLPNVTTRVDDALRLLPVGCGAKIVVTWDRLADAIVFDPVTGEEWDQVGLRRDARGRRRPLAEFVRTFKHAATPALALCAAILHARS